MLVFAQDNGREFMQGVEPRARRGREDRGLGYRVALADNDARKMIEQVRRCGR